MRDVAEVVALIQRLPDGTTFTRAAVLKLCGAEVAGDAGSRAGEEAASVPAPPSWKEKLWTVPAQTRLGVAEISEALGKQPSAIHKLRAREKRDRAKGRPVDALPCRKAFDGTLTCTAGELRDWLDRTDKRQR